MCIDNANKESADANSKDVAEIKKSIDVKLLELPNEEWCKVSFDGIEGYIKTSNLTSSYTTPNIVEKNRIQRILLKVNINMELNKVSGLTLNDYKKIFTGLPNDTNKIFQDNYQVFYNMEKKYNINGLFLASMAIHESGWGTSQIANDKKNLFGYGSYDNTPYESSFEFTDYSEGIETVAKSLVKYYLNPSGTKIYDGETAAGWYYNGPTLSGVNTRYATDQDWHKKVYSYMELLYNRL
ncbi:MAG: glucosaminidase domain-containing protein [Clostridia bacterium]